MSYTLIDAGVNLTNHQFDEQHHDVVTRAMKPVLQICLL